MIQSAVIQIGIPAGGFYEHIKLGIAAYRDEFTNWALDSSAYGCMPSHNEGLSGAIAFIGNMEVLEAWKATGVPVVNVSRSLKETPFPSVLVDDVRAGELAGEHFVERGFEHFAYLGPEFTYHSICREEGFRSVVGDGAQSYSAYKAPDPAKFHYKLFSPHLLSWIKAMPMPCAVFCNDDQIASNLINVLVAECFEVPAQIAVLGVNNDEVRCAYARRPLSSVAINGREIGYKAGELLHQLLRGEKPVQNTCAIAPTGVALRLSTDITANRNPVVARALQHIRNSLTQPMGAQDVATVAGVSRRVLESHFNRHLGHGPYEEIMRQRMKRAKQLMVDTDWPIHRIAAACGFAEHSLFSANFRKREGVSPTVWRKAGKALNPAPVPEPSA